MWLVLVVFYLLLIEFGSCLSCYVVVFDLCCCFWLYCTVLYYVFVYFVSFHVVFVYLCFVECMSLVF